MKNKLIPLYFCLMTMLFSCSIVELNNSNILNTFETYITLSLDNTEIRTVLEREISPSALRNFILKGSKDGEPEIILGSWETYSFNRKSIPLTVGTWCFTLTANYRDNILTGTVEQEIVTGSNALSFNLSLSETGSSTSSFHISFKDSNNNYIHNCSCYLETIDGTQILGRSDTGSFYDIPAGTYRLNAKFYSDLRNTYELGSWKEIIHVLAGDYISATRTIDYLDQVSTITYVLNNGKFQTSTGIEIPEKFSRKTPKTFPQAIRRDYYTFDGWYTDPNFSNESKVVSTEGFSEDLTVYAKWIPVSYNIMYKMWVDDNAPIYSLCSYTIEDDVLLPPISIDEIEFHGWEINSSSVGISLKSISGWNAGDKTGDVVLYADYYIQATANENNICEKIQNMKKPGTITASGNFSNELIVQIGEAIKNNTKVGIKLALSNTAGLTSVSDFAFYDCKNLLEITLPMGVTNIGKSAFEGCTKLKHIVLPNSITTINERAFYNCSTLEELTLPSELTAISTETFSYCSKITSLTIPASVNTMYRWAFSNSCIEELIFEDVSTLWFIPGGNRFPISYFTTEQILALLELNTLHWAQNQN